MGISAFLALATVLVPSTPYGPSDIAAWDRLLAGSCPASHISEWMPERNKADLIDTFEAHLSLTQQRKLRRVADTRRVCSDAQGDTANSCEAITDIHALRTLGLLASFTHFACAQVRCSEPATCEKPDTDTAR
jgi:hypothetical protein